jgi:hypothetical protein
MSDSILPDVNHIMSSIQNGLPFKIEPELEPIEIGGNARKK